MAFEEKKNERSALYESFDARTEFSPLPADTDTVKLRNILRYTLKNLMEECFLTGSFQAELLYEENIAYIAFLEKLFRQNP